MTEPSKNIVIVGGGFGGSTVARELRARLPESHMLILISEESYLTFNPLLPEVVGASIFPEQVVAPDLAIVHYNRGIAWRAKGDYDRAIADYDQALRLDPKHEDAYVNRGAAWSDKGDLDRAIADYTEAIRLDRANAYSLYGRGVAKLKKGDTAGGNADIAAAKAIKPDIAVVSAGYGITVDAVGANAAPEHK